MKDLTIRLTTAEDLPAVLSVYEDARRFMRRTGNMNQWTGGYPGEDVVTGDIRRQYSHVCVAGGEILGVFSVIFGEDPTYAAIYEGRWKNELPYAAVHRLAVRSRGKGVAAFCLGWCLEKYGNLRVDTHRDNIPMQRLLLKNGFSYCGIIYLPDGSERLAYQKTATASGGRLNIDLYKYR